jgi:WXXGXW repeat (2 copies)
LQLFLDGFLGVLNMFVNKVLVSVMIAAGTIGVVATPVPSVAATYREVIVDRAPPAPRDERVPAARRGYAWTPGYWDWRSNRHVWVRGNWVRERRGYEYRPHQWVERDGRWNLERGRWDRRD